MLIFLNGVASGFQAGFSVLGAFFILMAFSPQLYKIWRTKNTCSVNRLMYALHFFVAFSFFISSVLLNFSGSDVGTKVTANVMIFLNLFIATGCLYVFLLKTQNTEDSKKLGLSEHNFYQMHILPQIQKSMQERPTTGKFKKILEKGKKEEKEVKEVKEVKDAKVVKEEKKEVKRSN